MKLGFSVDSEWIWSMLIDNGGQPLYQGQLIAPTNVQQAAELIANIALNMQRMFGALTLIGINLMPDSWQDASPKAKETLSQWLSTHLTVPYQILNPAVIALAQIQPLPQGNTLSAVLDDGCELYVTDQFNPNDPYRHVLDLSWAHKPLKGYQSLIDGLTPLCTCGSDECIRQYLSRKGSSANIISSLYNIAPRAKLFKMLIKTKHGQPVSIVSGLISSLALYPIRSFTSNLNSSS